MTLFNEPHNLKNRITNRCGNVLFMLIKLKSLLFT